LPEKAKAAARQRLAAVDQVDALAATMTRTAAVALVAAQADVAASTLWTWLQLAAGVARADRLPALAPRHKGRTETAACDPRAWDFLVADYLRPEQPSFAACYRRLTEAAAAQGWAPVPAAKTLQRRLERDIPRGAQVLARKGAQAAKAVYPHQTRDRGVFHALEAVNADGHRFDVFVRWEDGSIGRPVMVAVQDLYSGMVLAHRIDRTENWTAVRLAFADLVESFGIPDKCWLDNGRNFASKWLTGGAPNRYRFKVRDDEPAGVLTQLGVEIHWTTPYHGQAKPIERAFRDLCEEIAKHPACAGAYCGNRPDAKPENYGSKAVPIAGFQALVAAEIARHNSRPGRRSANAAGRSLAETFRASFAAAVTARRAGPEQRRLLLAAAEAVTARRPTGEVVLEGNRYWAEPLADEAGRKLVLRFDPQNLLRPVSVYALDGRYLCDAPVIEATGFDSVDAAREHARLRRSWLKAQREMLAAERRLTIDQVAALLPAPEPVAVPAPKVVRLFADRSFEAPLRAAPQDEGALAVSSDRLAQLFGEASILPFQPVPPAPRNEEGGRG